MNIGEIYGVPMPEVYKAVLFYKKYGTCETYKELLVQLKRERLKLELEKIEAELEELNKLEESE